MRLREFIKKIIPYGVIMYAKNKRRKDFVNGYLLYKRKNYKKIECSKRNYKNIISVQGFGYSGSGAILDLFREFTNMIVIGYVDAEGSKAKKEQSAAEIDLLRLSGGLLEIEKFLGSNNIFLNDALLNRFISLSENSFLFKWNDKTNELFYQFFEQISDLNILNLDKVYYNGHLTNLDRRSSIFFLKNIDLECFRNISRMFLESLFTEINTTSSDYIVIDQLLTDFEFNNVRDHEYIHDLKSIIVTRDPRDVYYFACKKNVEWIPHNSIYDYVKWYKTIYSRLPSSNSNYLIVKFEDLVLNYNNVLNEIVSFLGVDIKHHSNIKMCFDPSYSKKNVGIWENDNEKSSEFATILSELADYCYGC